MHNLVVGASGGEIGENIWQFQHPSSTAKFFPGTLQWKYLYRTRAHSLRCRVLYSRTMVRTPLFYSLVCGWTLAPKPYRCTAVPTSNYSHCRKRSIGVR